MTNEENVEKQIRDFFLAIAPIEGAFTNDSFSYVALRRDEAFVIVQARMFLNTQKLGSLPSSFQSPNVKAAHFLLRDVHLNREAVMKSLIAGYLSTPDGTVLFPANESRQYSAFYQPFHDDGLKTQSRFAHLTVCGGPIPEIRMQPSLDWELRAADTPYDGIQDILNEFGPGLIGENSRIEVVAFNAATIDFGSVVTGETAKLALRTTTSADISKISVGYRVLDAGRIVQRRKLAGSDLSWSDQEGYKLGNVEFTVPRAAVVHATAVYDGIAQQHYYFSDPNAFQNPRRAAYEAFDAKCALFDDILSRAQSSKPDSREFEAAMPWLFWMLGFAPSSLVGVRQMSNAPDTLLCTPKGNIAVVECTVGLLKDDSKLTKLHDRVQAVRRNLEHSSTRHLRVLPVMVTAKSVEEVRPDLDQAIRLGVYVVTREGIERLKQRTLLISDADQLFGLAEQELAVALDKLNTIDGGGYVSDSYESPS